jgi:CBS domain-containing protein
MKRIRDVIAEKSLQRLVTVEPWTTVAEAAHLMTEWNVGALLVMQDGQLVGLLSERDYVRGIACAGRHPEGVAVRDIMTRNVRMVSEELTSEECMSLMTHFRTRHLPVLSGNKVLGVISIGDLVKDVVSEKAFIIDELERYIARVPFA